MIIGIMADSLSRGLNPIDLKLITAAFVLLVLVAPHMVTGKGFKISRMADYGKFDIRLDSSGRYYFIDCNSNPAFGPKECGCAISYILDLYEISFSDILKRLIVNTLRDVSEKSNKII